MMNGNKDDYNQGWEVVDPMMADGKYNHRVWEDIRYGVRNVRGKFVWVTVGVRYMPTTLNYGGENPEADREWLKANALGAKNVMSPDGGRNYFFVLHIKSPHVSTFLDLVTRNEKFEAAYATGRRPIVVFNNVTFSFNHHAGAMELQTLANQRGSVCPNTTMCWVNNYADLPHDYTERVLATFTGDQLPAADGYGTEVDEEEDDEGGDDTETENQSAFTAYEIFTQLDTPADE